MIRLSERLQRIAERVPSGSRLADIGSDHALLPAYLALNGTISCGIAGEVNAGPYEAASKQIEQSGVGHKVQARLGDGLAVIQPGDVNVITIAGMGGSLISSILEAGKEKLSGVGLLILQPNVGEEFVREWLVRNNWSLQSEQILEEDGKIYEILTAQPKLHGASEDGLYEPFMLNGEISVTKQDLLRMGPYLLRNPNPVWIKKWESELAKLAQICRQLSRSEQTASRQKEHEIRELMQHIEEVLACLQKVKPSFN